MYSQEQIEAIYRRSGGKCHICGRMVYLKNYGRPGRRGAWEADHVNARANGGSDTMGNLKPAHIACNREKGTMTARAVRARYGRTKAPMSTTKKAAARRSNAVTVGMVGATLGALAGGPPGALLGGAIGALIGHETDPE